MPDGGGDERDRVRVVASPFGAELPGAPTIAIDDLDDPRIEPYCRVRERDLAGRSGLFVAEGDVVVRALLSAGSRFGAHSLLLAEGRGLDIAAMGRQVDPDLPVFVASRTVMDRIVGFPIHRGILALARRGVPESVETVLPSAGREALVVGAVGLSNHDNVGGVFRNAAAFGAGAVLLDSGSCDPLYRKAIRVSVGAVLSVPFARGGSGADLVSTLETAGFTCFALSPSGREPLARVAWPDRTALLVGSEGPGLPCDLLASVRTVRIPVAVGWDSLNVATAAGIALHAVSMRHD